MKRPDLNQVPLELTELFFGKPSLNVTMSAGQWDGLLQEAYDMGWTLIELDDDEVPVRAYRKGDTP